MTTWKMISRDQIIKFIRKNKLNNIEVFLEYISDSRGISKFLSYAKISKTVSITNKILFHGTRVSPSGDADFKFPKHKFYATGEPAYAIFMSLLNLTNGSASVISSKTITSLKVGLDFVNGSSTIENGYIVVLTRKGFKKKSNNEFITAKVPVPLFYFRTKPTDLVKPITIDLKRN